MIERIDLAFCLLSVAKHCRYEFTIPDTNDWSCSVRVVSAAGIHFFLQQPEKDRAGPGRVRAGPGPGQFLFNLRNIYPKLRTS